MTSQWSTYSELVARVAAKRLIPARTWAASSIIEPELSTTTITSTTVFGTVSTVGRDTRPTHASTWASSFDQASGKRGSTRARASGRLDSEASSVARGLASRRVGSGGSGASSQPSQADVRRARPDAWRVRPREELRGAMCCMGARASGDAVPRVPSVV